MEHSCNQNANGSCLMGFAADETCGERGRKPCIPATVKAIQEGRQVVDELPITIRDIVEEKLKAAGGMQVKNTLPEAEKKKRVMSEETRRKISEGMKRKRYGNTSSQSVAPKKKGRDRKPKMITQAEIDQAVAPTNSYAEAVKVAQSLTTPQLLDALKALTEEVNMRRKRAEEELDLLTQV